MSAFWQKHCRLLMLSALSALLVGCDAHDTPLGMPGWYWSKDMKPVAITFMRLSPPPDPKRPPDIVIPRAYVALASPYKWSKSGALPDKLIDVRELYLQIALDTGEPLPIAAAAGGLARTNYATGTVGIGELRLPPSAYPPPPRPGAWTPGTEIDFDGYVRIPSPNGFYQITGCGVGAGTAPPRPDLHCTYSARIARNVHIHMSFSDYRAMGGLPYAERNIATIKNVICKYTDCSN